QFALDDGSVTVRREEGQTYWGLAEFGDLPVPPKAPRRVSRAVLEQCALAEEALGRAVAQYGRFVNRREVFAHGLAASATSKSRLPRMFEPAIEAGRVVVIHEQREVFYGPSGRRDLSLPSISNRSDYIK